MTKGFKWRGLLVLVCLVLSLVSLGPTLFRESLPDWWNKAFDPIHLGLDLQGGMHLVLGVDVDKAVDSRLDSVADQTESLLREKDIVFKRVDRLAGERLAVTVYDEAAGAQVDALMKESFPSLEPLTIADAGGFIQKSYRLSSREVENIKDYAVRQALETLRNRVDQFGVSEPTLQRQGENRILIQLPGVKDPDRAIALLGKTARLEFKERSCGDPECITFSGEVVDEDGNFVIPAGDVNFPVLELEADERAGAGRAGPGGEEPVAEVRLDELDDLGCTVVATDRREPHVPYDLTGALALAVGRRLTTLARTPLLATTLALDHALAPLLRRTRFSNAYRIIARRNAQAPPAP